MISVSGLINAVSVVRKVANNRNVHTARSPAKDLVETDSSRYEAGINIIAESRTALARAPEAAELTVPPLPEEISIR